MKKIHLDMQTQNPHLTVLRMILRLCGVPGQGPLKVLSWMCGKADSDGKVILIAAEYKEELGMTPQHFHNNLGILKKYNFVEGEDTVYELTKFWKEALLPISTEIEFKIRLTPEP